MPFLQQTISCSLIPSRNLLRPKHYVIKRKYAMLEIVKFDQSLNKIKKHPGLSRDLLDAV